MEQVFEIESLEALAKLAGELVVELPRGSLIGLTGSLGAGKTTLVQEFARALGCKDPVTSPTYTLEHRYSLPDGGTIYHLDLYRLKDPEILLSISEILEDRQGLVFIEWFEKFKEISDLAEVIVSLEIVSPTLRKITLRTGVATEKR